MDIEIWNQRQAAIIDELITPESVCLSDTGVLRGPEEFKTWVHQAFLSAFPDLRVNIEGTVAEGDEVVVRWTATATHTGDGFGFPPTGKQVAFRE